MDISQYIKGVFPKIHPLFGPFVVRISLKADEFWEIMACPMAFDFSYNDLYIDRCETIWRMYHAIVNLGY